jgi:hypothetical protein
VSGLVWLRTGKKWRNVLNAVINIRISWNERIFLNFDWLRNCGGLFKKDYSIEFFLFCKKIFAFWYIIMKLRSRY